MKLNGQRWFGFDLEVRRIRAQPEKAMDASSGQNVGSR